MFKLFVMEIPIHWSKTISTLVDAYDALEKSTRQDELFKLALIAAGTVKTEEKADILLFMVKEAKKTK